VVRLDADKCCDEGVKTLIFACSGGSNVGQIANRAAIQLTKQKYGKMYCLAGIGAQLKGFITTTKAADQIITIDGCSTHCAKKTLELADLPPNIYVTVSDLGIKKSYNIDDITEDKVNLVTKAINNYNIGQ